MYVIYIFEVRYICRLVPRGYVLNPYTPISFA